MYMYAMDQISVSVFVCLDLPVVPQTVYGVSVREWISQHNTVTEIESK